MHIVVSSADAADERLVNDRVIQLLPSLKPVAAAVAGAGDKQLPEPASSWRIDTAEQPWQHLGIEQHYHSISSMLAVALV